MTECLITALHGVRDSLEEDINKLYEDVLETITVSESASFQSGIELSLIINTRHTSSYPFFFQAVSDYSLKGKIYTDNRLFASANGIISFPSQCCTCLHSTLYRS